MLNEEEVVRSTRETIHSRFIVVFLQTRQNVFTREEEKTKNTEELRGTRYNVFVRRDRIGFWRVFFSGGTKTVEPGEKLA